MKHRARKHLWGSAFAGAIILCLPIDGRADEGGVSFWAPGTYASLAAVPLEPGWTVNELDYHWQGQAGADVAVAREITIGRFSPTLGLNLSGNVFAHSRHYAWER